MKILIQEPNFDIEKVKKYEIIEAYNEVLKNPSELSIDEKLQLISEIGILMIL
jgi:hypothetical protein